MHKTSFILLHDAPCTNQNLHLGRRSLMTLCPCSYYPRVQPDTAWLSSYFGALQYHLQSIDAAVRLIDPVPHTLFAHLCIVL